MNNKIYLLITSIVFFVITSCSEEEALPINETQNLHLITEQKLGQLGLDLRVYSQSEELYTGYNQIFIELLKTGTDEHYGDATVMLSPMMNMGDMMHAAPTEDPKYMVDKNYFEGAVVFVMPSSSGSWSLTVSVKDNASEETESIEIPVQINMPDESRLLSFIENDEKYFISLVKPADPEVGINDFEIAVHLKETMMSWPYVDDLEFEIVPEMPSMDHGSPNNINPVHSQSGHYSGKVNFTMDGYWKVHLNVYQHGEQIGENLAFDITFSATSNQ